jgi:hypothetical protein
MQNEIYTHDLLLCTFLWLNVPDTDDQSYYAQCDAVQSRLSDEQWHELETTFNI